jgi:UDP-glucuronate 4-epimerase
MSSILVTGCAGFVGSHLTDALLRAGYKVVGIDNFDSFYRKELKQHNLAHAYAHENFSFYNLDITEKESLNGIIDSIDVVIHLAAKAGVLPSLKNPEAYIKTNIVGTHHVLDFIKSRGITKYVFASSSSVYGNTKTIPFVESDSVNLPISPYAFTKKSCELLNHTYYYLHGINTINLRLFTVYGPRQRPDLAIHKFIDQISRGEEITMYGNGSSSRDYTYVSDTVDGIMKAMEYLQERKNVYEVINIGNNKPVRLSELIETVARILGKPARIKRMEVQSGDVDITFANIDKAKALLNYHPKTLLESGIRSFADWHNERALLNIR